MHDSQIRTQVTQPSDLVTDLIRFDRFAIVIMTDNSDDSDLASHQSVTSLSQSAVTAARLSAQTQTETGSDSGSTQVQPVQLQLRKPASPFVDTCTCK